MTSNLEFKRNLAEAAERMQRLWDLLDPLDRVPVCISVPYTSEHKRKADGTFFSRPGDYLGEIEKLLQFTGVRGVLLVTAASGLTEATRILQQVEKLTARILRPKPRVRG